MPTVFCREGHAFEDWLEHYEISNFAQPAIAAATTRVLGHHAYFGFGVARAHIDGA